MKTMKNKKNSNGQTKTPKKTKRGFTLVEILIVVAVIGILFVSLVPRIDFAGDKARETGVKTDFRSFELAAEQLLRENAGLADHNTVLTLCEDDGINLYLDDELEFDGGSTNKNDPWNMPYTVQVVQDSDEDYNVNNGAIIFISGGKDCDIGDVEDNYVLVVSYVNGKIDVETTGFSSNIDCDGIAEITVGEADFMVDEVGGHVVTYEN